MKKRIISLLCALVLLIGLLPTQALAYVGAIRTTEEERAAVTTSRISNGGVQYLVLQNDYITFAVQATGSGSVLRSYTVPTAQLNSNNDIFAFPAETNRFRVSDMSTQDSGTINNCLSAKELRITGISGTVEYDDYTGNMTANVNLTFNDNRLTATAAFYLERVNHGQWEGSITEQDIPVDLTEAGNHWAVSSSVFFRLTDIGEGQTGQNGKAIMPYHIKEYPLASMGHKNMSATAPLMLSVAEEISEGAPWPRYQRTDFYAQNLTSGLGCSPTYNRVEYDVPVQGVSWTMTKAITTYYTEVYTENYLAANPFVGLGTFHYSNVEGHWGSLGQYVSSSGNCATVYHWDHPLYTIDAQESCTVTSLWGFRDLYAKGDAEAPTQPDKVEVEVNADKLAILRSSSGSIQVQPYDGDQGLAQVKSAFPGYTHIATLRGNYKTTSKVDFNNNPFADLFEWANDLIGGNTTYTYEFTDGAAALSPTVTATWGSGGSFSITTDGKITQNGISLSAPSFKFYTPKNGGGLTLGFDANGVTMDFEPEKNGAIFALDIPHATSLVEMGYADMDGSLRFTGQMAISTLFDGAAFDMEELGYGLKNGEFTVNGVRATGSFDTATLIGLDLAEVNGSINTFEGQESYAFDVQLDLFSLVKAEAELELKRLQSNGALIPDDLYLNVGGSALPILTVVPTVPVAQITGGGLGFYNLADTINGNYYAIPPITLRGTVKGKYVQLLKGTTDMVIGPGAFEFTASDISIAGMESLKIIKEAGMGLYMGGQHITYQGTEYSGMNFSGKANLEAGLPSVSQNFLKLDSGVALSMYGGLNDVKNKLYVQASGNSRISAELQFPDSWKVIGGLKLLGAGVDVAVGGRTVIPVSGDLGNSFQGAFNNMKLYFGIMGQASLLGSSARLWVILPKSAATGSWWDFEFYFLKGLPEWSWDGRIQGLRSTVRANAASAGRSLLTNPTSEAASTQTVQVNVTNETDGAYLVLALDPTVTEEQLQANLKVTGPDGVAVNLEWLKADADGTITNAEQANVISGVAPRTDGSGEDRVVIIHLGQGTSHNGSYTITTASTASTSRISTFSNTELLFQADARAINAQADALGHVAFTGNDVSGSVDNPEQGVTYVLRTYLSQEKGGTDYLVDEQVLTDSANFHLTVPSSGTAAPSGNYYVSTFLMRQEAGDFDGDGTEEADEIALLGIGNSSSEHTVAYTNTMQPGQVQHVSLTATGNEAMQATWQEVSDADGYRITIYHADGTDTGMGYEYDASQFSGQSQIPGLNLENGSFSIDMAMTAGGATTEDGTPITLDAGKEYIVGVTAYRSETIGEQDIKYYGVEQQSSATLLPEYTPLEMTIRINGTDLTADANGIYHATSNVTGNGLTVEAPENDNATFTVTRLDTGAELENVAIVGYAIPDVDGTLMLAVTGSVTNGTVTDTTTRYVLFSHDSTAPVITLDEEMFYADPSTRTYTITGVTDPGTTVIMAGDADEWGDATVLTATAAEDGTFSLSGILTSGDTMSRIVSATDQAGNETTTSVMITLLTEYTVHFDANGGSGTMPDDTASVGTSYTLPDCTFTPPQGKQFKAWSTDPDSTTEYAPGASMVLDEDTTFYALWEDAPHTHSGVLHTGYAATCDAPGEKDYYTCSCNKFFEDAACTKEITDLETWKVIPATGHKLTHTGAIAPTCTQEGYTGDEVCTVCQKVITPGKTLEKLPHDYKDGTCTMCGTPSPTTTPTITSGANSIWVKGSKDGLSVTSSAACGDFVKVQVDGKDLAASHYTVQGDGTTVVTLKAPYLETLSVGKHTLAIVSKTGTATTEFTIQAPPTTGGNTQTPPTGDGHHTALWVGLLATCGVLLSAGLWYTTRRKATKHP